MCTYDYTPYTGCKDGEQHYYIQWVKCNRAAEKGRYCSLDQSVEVEQLKNLSANVISCPIHGPIAVQQHVFDLARDQAAETEKPQALVTTRRGRATQSSTSSQGGEQPARREARRRRSARRIYPESSDSESSSSLLLPERPRASHRARRSRERGKSPMARENLHRRASSAEIGQTPSQALSMRHGRSDVSLPLKLDTEAWGTTETRQARPARNALAIPFGNGVVGLPARPDVHRRSSSAHRSGSEALLGQSTESQSQSNQPPPRGSLMSSSDSSPDHNPELPFSMPAPRRGRRPGPRSIRDRSVDTVMRRIDEHVVAEESGEPQQQSRAAQRTDAAHSAAPTESHNSATTTPPEPQREPQQPANNNTAAARGSSHHRTEDSKPRLNSLQIPNQRDQPQREAYSAPTATLPPEQQDLLPSPPRLHGRSNSLKHVDAASSWSAVPKPGTTSHNEETASIRSARSRRFEDQIAEGRKWAAAREYMPIAAAAARGPMTDVLAHLSDPKTMPVGVVGPSSPSRFAFARRESADSGYRSGQGQGQGYHTQWSWESSPQVGGQARDGESGAATAAATATATGLGGGDGGGGGSGRLQKSPPQPQPQLPSQPHPSPQLQPRELGGLQRPAVPAPVGLGVGVGGLPPCALPVSLVSPTSQPDLDGGKGAKTPLLQRMGLKKKFSGLLWDRGGQRAIGAIGG